MGARRVVARALQLTAKREVPRGVGRTPESDDGTLVIGLPHFGDRLDDDHDVEDPRVEQDPPLAEADTVPRLSKVPELVDDLLKPLPGQLTRAGELFRLLRIRTSLGDSSRRTTSPSSLHSCPCEA